MPACPSSCGSRARRASFRRVVELTAYRLIQEGLTNALKHAHASRAEVAVTYGEDEIEVTVSDDGQGIGNGDGGGHGLVGMRERVSVYGGELDAGPQPGGGYRLRARLPLDAVSLSVLIVDDQALVRAGFRMIIDAEEDIEVAGEAADGADAVDGGAPAQAGRRPDGRPHAERRRDRGDAAAARRRRASRRRS